MAWTNAATRKRGLDFNAFFGTLSKESTGNERIQKEVLGMDKKEQETKDLMQDLQNESEAIRQSVTIGRLIQDAADREHERAKGTIKILAGLLALSLLINMVVVGAFLWYESQWEYESTTTTTTTVEQDTGTGEGNNIYQSGESAQYHEAERKGE